MTYNWWIYTEALEFVEEVYMTEAEFFAHLKSKSGNFLYKKFRAGSNWQ